MSFSDFFSKLKNGAETTLAKVTSRPLLEAVSGAAVLVAYADGSCSSEEKEKTGAALKLKLPQFEGGDIIKAWNKAELMLSMGVEFGTPDVLKEIAKGAKTPEHGDLVVRVAILIGGADGNFDDNEKAVVRRICEHLSLPARNYGL